MERAGFIHDIRRAFRVTPVVAILGPRQCGKTTLARIFGRRRRRIVRFDLEDTTHLARLKDPKLALEDLTGLVVIDEVQRMPELFPALRVLVDRPRNRARFLILGSASGDLLRQTSESLAGRITHIELTPFQLQEVGAELMIRLWVRGGFPKAFLAQSNSDAILWKGNFVATFLERDVPSFGVRIPPRSLRRFWMMLAHYHGQVLNTSDLGRSLGMSDKTVRRYMDVLSATFMIRQLAPWHSSTAKRQVKSPKIYFRDNGILHHFLGLDDYRALYYHPRLGASWESFALEEIIRASKADDEDVFFWATHQGAVLDLLVIRKGKRFGYVFKYSSSPRLTKSMKIAMADLGLKHLDVVYPGKESFPLADKVRAVGLAEAVAELRR
ncbi:MAG: ATP-binding protein [bacterium]|nr:ATP-binding protein [bacterium]